MFNKQIKTTMKKKSTEINDAVTKRAKMDRFDTKEKMERLKVFNKCFSENIVFKTNFPCTI